MIFSDTIFPWVSCRKCLAPSTGIRLWWGMRVRKSDSALFVMGSLNNINQTLRQDQCSREMQCVPISKHYERWFPPSLETIPCIFHVNTNRIVLEHWDQLRPSEYLRRDEGILPLESYLAVPALNNRDGNGAAYASMTSFCTLPEPKENSNNFLTGR